MIRRYASSGKFKPAAPMSDVPLLEAAFARPVKSRPHCAAEQTKRERHRARVLAVASMIAAECRAVEVLF